LADINTEDAADLVYLLAKSVAYPMGNKFLEPTASNGQIVLAVNPAWAKRLGAAFPDVADMEALLFEHAWQPVELWPKAIRRIRLPSGWCWWPCCPPLQSPRGGRRVPRSRPLRVRAPSAPTVRPRSWPSTTAGTGERRTATGTGPTPPARRNTSTTLRPRSRP